MSTLTKAVLAQCVKELAQLPAAENDGYELETWRRIMGRAFRSWAVSDDHAQRITAHIVAHHHWRPTPADVREVADRMPRSVEKRRADPQCQSCYGSGWRSIEREGYWFSERCSCVAKAVETATMTARQSLSADKLTGVEA